MKKILLPFFGALLLLIACETFQQKDNEQQQQTAEENAGIYCGACHQFPKPDLLTKTMWKEEVLPKMAHFMGLFKSEQERLALIENNTGGQRVLAQNIFPTNPLVDSVTFQQICNWYIRNAPEKFENKPVISEKNSLDYFTMEKGPAKYHPPSTTLLKLEKDGKILFGDANASLFQLLDPQQKPKIAAELAEAPVHAFLHNGFAYVTCMGSFSPTDEANGLLVKIPNGSNGPGGIVIDSLQRPVHTTLSDLDEDGYQDLLICEFGKYTGALNLYAGMPNEKFKKVTLHPKPGAIKTYVKDMNGDGRKDVVALFAQADEGIDIFFNQGNHQYKRQRVISFPPGYGSSSFQLKDINLDGFDDIIYTAGDNADFKHILRPYHGIYLYLNNGKNAFKQEEFIALPGAYDARMEDFDVDGDQDIAAISFFPDWQASPSHGFVMFENSGGNTYEAHALKDANIGRWIVMDAGDMDQDGDVDIILGSLTMETVPDIGLVKRWTAGGIPYVILRNTRK